MPPLSDSSRPTSATTTPNGLTITPPGLPDAWSQNHASLQPEGVLRTMSSDSTLRQDTLESWADPESPSEKPTTSSIARQSKSKVSLVLTLTSLYLAVAVAALDMTIVSTALPTMVAYFGSPAGYTWIGGSFTLAYTASTPLWGAVGDIWGRRHILLVALGIFFVGSLVCSLVTTLGSFVAGRAIQGLGASGMQTMVYIAICDLFSLRDRSLYLALTSGVWAIASSVGPVLGGVFTSRLGWRWCFWINLPISFFVFVAIVVCLKLPTPNVPILDGVKAVDWSGSILLMGATFMILLGLDLGGQSHPWGSSLVICLLVFGVLCIGLFAANEHYIAKNPVIPLRLFSLASAPLYAIRFGHGYVFLGVAYYMPLYFQSALNLDSLTSGLYLLPFIVSLCVSSACAGIFIQKTGSYVLMMRIGLALMTLGVGLFLHFNLHSGAGELVIVQIIAGTGVGMVIEGPVLSAQALESAQDTAAVAATMSFVRSISTVFSMVLGGVVFRNLMDKPGLAEHVGSDIAAQFTGAQAMMNVPLITTLPPEVKDIVRKRYLWAMEDIWIMYAVISGLSLLVVVFVRQRVLSKDRSSVVLGVNARNKAASETALVHDSTVGFSDVETIPLYGRDYMQDYIGDSDSDEESAT